MEKVVVILGPTGVGKTKLSIELAKSFNGEIINGDSMQMYELMDIGTAKIKEEEKEGIPHHLFSFLKLQDRNSIYDYQKLIRDEVSKITKRGKLPIVVGGTGLYLKAFLYDYEFVETNLSFSSQEAFKDLTNEELYARLREVDYEASFKIHFNNRRRVERALDIYYSSGNKKSESEAKQENKLLYDALTLGLTLPRKTLHKLQDDRVEKMFEEGLVKEVTNLYQNYCFKNSPASKAIGYKEFEPYFDNLVSLEEVKEAIKIHTHQYSKRQYTFFNNKFDVSWLNSDINNFNNTINEAIKLVKEKFNL